MKKFLFFPIAIFMVLLSCKTSDKIVADKSEPTKNDTIRIANDELEYEIIIIDPGFSSWLNSIAKPRQYYTQTYLETKNRIWVNQWNQRAMNPQRYNNLYEMPIDYQSTIDYGYEVNYLLFNYLTYFQIANKTKFVGFDGRI